MMVTAGVTQSNTASSKATRLFKFLTALGAVLIEEFLHQFIH